MVLLSHRKNNQTLKFWRSPLFSFLWGAKGVLSLCSYFHALLENDVHLKAWHMKLFECRICAHLTNNDFIGRGLLMMWMKLKESDEAKKNDTSLRQTRAGNSEPELIAKLQKFTDVISKRYNFEKATIGEKSKQPRCVCDSIPKSDPLCHDNYARDNPNSINSIYPSPCPGCNHC